MHFTVVVIYSNKLKQDSCKIVTQSTSKTYIIVTGNKITR